MRDKKKPLTYVYRITIIATLGGFLFGYDTAVVSGAVRAISEFFAKPFSSMTGISENVITGFTVSSALIGCIIGGMMAGFISLKLGRKKGLMLAAVLFILSGIGAVFPEKAGIPDIDPLITFVFYRIIGGIGIGLASMLSPLYIAEISPAEIRGKLVSWNQFAIVLGILIVYFVNWFISGRGDESWNITTGWRWMFLSSAFPSLIFILLLFLVPETPRYLVIKNRTNKALEVLKKTIGENESNESLKEISRSLQDRSASWLSYGWLVIITGISLAAFQQLTGINVVLYYAPVIFQNTGTGIDISLLQTVLVGAVNMVFTIIAIMTVDRLGRKPLLLAGGILMGLSMATLGFVFNYGNMGPLALAVILIYIAGFAMSWGPVMWVVMSEIFPNSIRGAMSVATATVWITDLLITLSFPVLDGNKWLIDKFNHGFAYWIYAIICLFAVVFVWIMVPETKGKTLEQIEELWRKNH